MDATKLNIRAHSPPPLVAFSLYFVPFFSARYRYSLPAITEWSEEKIHFYI